MLPRLVTGSGSTSRVWYQCVTGEKGDVERQTRLLDPSKKTSNHSATPCTVVRCSATYETGRVTSCSDSSESF